VKERRDSNRPRNGKGHFMPPLKFTKKRKREDEKLFGDQESSLIRRGKGSHPAQPEEKKNGKES